MTNCSQRSANPPQNLNPLPAARNHVRPLGKSVCRHRLATHNLKQCGNRREIHIGEGPIFPGHAPDKRVGYRTTAGMNRLGRRHNGLSISCNYVASLIGWPHQVEHPVGGGQIEVTVDPHPAIMSMRRHGVPDTAWFQHRQAHY